jgi:hypothetical protein
MTDALEAAGYRAEAVSEVENDMLDGYSREHLPKLPSWARSLITKLIRRIANLRDDRKRHTAALIEQTDEVVRLRAALAAAQAGATDRSGFNTGVEAVVQWLQDNPPPGSVNWSDYLDCIVPSQPALPLKQRMRSEGFAAGIEAAAELCDQRAIGWGSSEMLRWELEKELNNTAEAIRALRPPAAPA